MAARQVKKKVRAAIAKQLPIEKRRLAKERAEERREEARRRAEERKEARRRSSGWKVLPLGVSPQPVLWLDLVRRA